MGRGGALVAYGTASGLNDTGSVVRVFVGLVARLFSWNALPNSHRATFYNFWGGHRTRRGDGAGGIPHRAGEGGTRTLSRRRDRLLLCVGHRVKGRTAPGVVAA